MCVARTQEIIERRKKERKKEIKKDERKKERKKARNMNNFFGF